jgi:hypothetical protein
MTKRVFVSSTFVDLADYREQVLGAVRQLDAIDVSMEHFGARDERPKDECVRLITEDADVFVGIYGHRYGYVPANDEISITESEYEAATSAGLPRLIYLVDESVPWVPEYIDKGDSELKLAAFKQRLKASHMCALFRSKHDLAAKVAADLGRHFVNQQTRESVRTKSAPTIDHEREYRLIQDIKSADTYEATRAIRALAPFQSPWLVDALSAIVVGDDEKLADSSLDALRKISGRVSAKVISAALASPFMAVRTSAAFQLGEMALFGRRDDSLEVIDTLIELLSDATQPLRVLEEAVHSVSKIGGAKAFEALTKILAADLMPGDLKAMALHGPGRFWQAPEFAYNPSASLYNKFVSEATAIIDAWPPDLCKSVQQSHIFGYIRPPLKQRVASRAQTDDNA